MRYILNFISEGVSAPSPIPLVTAGFQTFRTLTSSYPDVSYPGVSNSVHSPDLNPIPNPLTLKLTPNPHTNNNPSYLTIHLFVAVWRSG